MKRYLIILVLGVASLISCTNRTATVDFPTWEEYSAIDFTNPPAEFQAAIDLWSDASNHALCVNEANELSYDIEVLREFGIPEEFAQKAIEDKHREWIETITPMLENLEAMGFPKTAEDLLLSAKKATGIIPYDEDDDFRVISFQ